MTSPPKSCNPPARRRPHVNVPIRGKQEECALRISLITRKLICRRATLWRYKSYPRLRIFLHGRMTPTWQEPDFRSRVRPAQLAEVEISSFPREPIYAIN